MMEGLGNEQGLPADWCTVCAVLVYVMHKNMHSFTHMHSLRIDESK